MYRSLGLRLDWDLAISKFKGLKVGNVAIYGLRENKERGIIRFSNFYNENDWCKNRAKAWWKALSRNAISSLRNAMDEDILQWS